MKTGFDYLLESADKLPSELASVVLEFNYTEMFRELMNKHKLHYDQSEILEDLTFRAMFGEISGSEFTARLVSECQLTPETAHDLTIDTEDNIVLKVKQALESRIEEIEAENDEAENQDEENVGESSNEAVVTSRNSEYAEGQRHAPDKYLEPINDEPIHEERPLANVIPIQKIAEPVDPPKIVIPVRPVEPKPVPVPKPEPVPEPVYEPKPVPIIKPVATILPPEPKPDPIPTPVVPTFQPINIVKKQEEPQQGFAEPKFKKYADLMGDSSPKENVPFKTAPVTKPIPKIDYPPVIPASIPTPIPPPPFIKTAPTVVTPPKIEEKPTTSSIEILKSEGPASIFESTSKPNPAPAENPAQNPTNLTTSGAPKPANIIRSLKPKSYSQIMNEMFGRAFENNPNPALNVENHTNNDPIARKSENVTVSSPTQAYIPKSNIPNGADPYREVPKR